MELYSQSYKPTQIARMMDVSAGTVKTYLDRVAEQTPSYFQSRTDCLLVEAGTMVRRLAMKTILVVRKKCLGVSKKILFYR